MEVEKKDVHLYSNVTWHAYSQLKTNAYVLYNQTDSLQVHAGKSFWIILWQGLKDRKPEWIEEQNHW